MNQIHDLVQFYRSNSLKALPKGAAYYLFKEGPTALYTKQILGPEIHQKIISYLGLGYWPQIDSPRTFNEKVLHRKLRTDDGRFADVEGKITVRDYVANRVGENILPKLYHVTDDPNDISFESLPDECVIKPTHMAGEVIFVDNNDELDKESIKDLCQEWLESDYGQIRNQYWNADIDRQIMVEERLRGEKSDIPLDYKFYVFHGRVEYIHVDFDRFGNPSRRFFDRDWNPQEFRKGDYPLGPTIDKPDRFEEMIDIAEALSEGFDFIRVDLYNLEEKGIVFGELTSAPASGMTPFYPQKYDFKFGSLW